jgi:hypothetical protein
VTPAVSAATFVISSAVENGGNGISDMHGKAATVAASESGDERVQISNISVEAVAS